jgi:hypothetical protein
MVQKFLIAALFIASFTLGFLRQRDVETRRWQTLVESTEHAERDYQDLIFAYELRLNTIRSLVSVAFKHGAAIPSDLVLAVDDLNEKVNVRDEHELQVYEREQKALDDATKDLIATLDSELTGDEHFARLFTEFTAQEQTLVRIKDSYAQQTQRVRALARKGEDRYFNSRVPAAID